MVGIPPPLRSDPEEVVWALETADGLWQRHERVDAIVWLRRASQAASEAQDDDRALALARSASELSDWLARNAPVDEEGVPSQGSAVDALLTQRPEPLAPGNEEVPLSAIPGDDLEEIEEVEAIEAPESEVPMLLNRRSSVPEPPPPPPPPRRHISEGALHIPVPTRAKLPSIAHESPGLAPPHRASASAPAMQQQGFEPLPSFELPPVSISPKLRTPDGREILSTDPAPPIGNLETERPDELNTIPPEAELSESDIEAADPIEVVDDLDKNENGKLALVPSEPAPASQLTSVGHLQPRNDDAPVDAGGVDLDGVEALASLGAEARAHLARTAKVQHIARGKHVADFGLALIVAGEADVTAPAADTPAQRLHAGAVLRTKGSLGDNFPLRLVAASDEVAIATWDAGVADAALASHAKLDGQLRHACDQIQARMGVSMGPLATKLDPTIREMFLERLDVRALAPYAELVTKGKMVPGILLVATGEVELISGDQVRGVVSSGEFVFANEVLGGGKAPETARAGKTGALVLHAGRMAAQELLVTCPPLLEIFAGM